MNALFDETRAFLAGKDREAASSLQLAAVQLICGVDLTAALRGAPEEQRRAVRRLERFVERERLKGLTRHWTYDLNRHIALVQAVDALYRALAVTEAAPAGDTNGV